MNLDLFKLICDGVSIALSLLCVLVLFLKKNKILLKDTAFEKIIVTLPSLIQCAESLFTKGSEKKTYVMSVSFSLLSKLLSLSPEEVARDYGDRISSAIENILETPQKKEVD